MWDQTSEPEEALAHTPDQIVRSERPPKGTLATEMSKGSVRQHVSEGAVLRGVDLGICSQSRQLKWARWMTRGHSHPQGWCLIVAADVTKPFFTHTVYSVLTTLSERRSIALTTQKVRKLKKVKWHFLSHQVSCWQSQNITHPEYQESPSPLQHLSSFRKPEDGPCCNGLRGLACLTGGAWS